MEKDTNKKFARGVFSLLALTLTLGPMIYAIALHEWLWLGLLISAQVGVAIKSGLKQIEKEDAANTPQR